MANNPLYPGYSPKKEDEASINPIYPGYYAGQPIQRRPVSKDFVKPIEYDADVLMAQVEEAAAIAGSTMFAAPKWVVDRVVNDFKDSLKIAIKPTTVNVTELDDYDMQDLPGAQGVSFSINPADYSRGARKQVKKTLGDWVFKATGVKTDNVLNSDFSDIQNKTRQRTWRLALGYGKEEAAFDFKAAKSTVEGLSAYGIKTAGSITTGGSPLDVSGTDVEYGGVSYKDLYKKTVDKVGEFEEKRGSSKFRGGSHDDFVKEAASALNLEIKAKRDTGLVSGNAAIVSQLNSHAEAIKFFNTKNNILNDVGGVLKTFKDRKDDLEILELGGTLPRKPGTPPRDPINELGSKITAARSSLINHVNTIETLKNTGKISEYSYNNIIKITNDYDNYLNNLDSTIGNIRTRGSNTKQALKALRLVENGPVKLGSGDVFKHDIKRDLLKNIEIDVLSTKARKNINGNLVQDHIGSLLQNETLRQNNFRVEGSKLAPVMYRLRREKVGYATQEVLESWDKEKLLENYLWNNRIKPRIINILPSTWVQKSLEKRNYFGLVISEKTMEILQTTNPKKYAKFAKKYAFNVKVGLDKEFYEVWGLKKLNVKGGKHFDFLNNAKGNAKKHGLFKMESGADRDMLKRLLTGTRDNTLSEQLAGKLFDGLSLSQVLGNSDYENQYKNFLKQLGGYKQWVRNNAGILGSNASDPDFQFALFEQLLRHNNKKLPPGYKLNRKYIGRFEKVHMRLERINQWFISTKLGKTIAALQNWKEIVSNKVSALLSKLISKLLAGAAASTGVLAVLLPIIEKAISFVLNKVLGYGEEMLKGMLKGDFSGLMEMFEKDSLKIMKSCVVGCAVILIPFYLLIIFFLGIFSSTVSPIDRTVPQTKCSVNSNNYFTLEKTVDFDGVGTATYTVKITPGTKASTIPADIEVTYSDSIVGIRKEIDPKTNLPEEIAFSIGSYGPITLDSPFSTKEFTYDVPIDVAEFQNSRIQNFFTLSIPKINNIDPEACHDQVIITSKSFTIGSDVPPERGYCYGYEAFIAQCEEN